MRTRPATLGDIPAIMTIVDEARGIMRSSGNMDQWTDGYPDEALIRSDIRSGYGFVVEDTVTGQEPAPVGYFAFIRGVEPTYNVIEGGAWTAPDEPYAVVHRLAGTREGHGVFDAMLAFATAHCSDIRIDTHRDNTIMQHNILKRGFKYCGIIYLESGDERLAYQLRFEGGQWSVRKAGLEDIPLLHNLAWNVFPQTYAAILSPEQTDYMMDWMYSEQSIRSQMTRDGHIYLLGCLNGVPVGYVSVQPEGDGLYHLQKLYVLPSQHGKGLGAKLFRAGVELIRSECGGPCRMELNVNRDNPALGFYKHMGMKELRSGDFPIGGGYFMNDYIMGMDL